MNSQIANAFTCTGPYAILILLGLKRVENRSSSPTPARGRCAISVSKTFCRGEYDNFMAWIEDRAAAGVKEIMPKWEDVREWPGKIVGTIDYCVGNPQFRSEQKQWDEGYRYWWCLSNPLVLKRPMPCRGNLGMWKLPEELAEKVAMADFDSGFGRMLRAVLRSDLLGSPEDQDAVRVFRGSTNESFDISIPSVDVAHDRIEEFLSGLEIDVEEIEASVEGLRVKCHADDAESIYDAIYNRYWLPQPIASIEEIRSYVDSHWVMPKWRIEMAPSDDGEDVVIVLVSDKCSSEEQAQACLEAHRLFANRFSFSLKGHFVDTCSAHNAVSYKYQVPRARFLSDAMPRHVKDCEAVDWVECGRQFVTR